MTRQILIATTFVLASALGVSAQTRIAQRPSIPAPAPVPAPSPAKPAAPVAPLPPSPADLYAHGLLPRPFHVDIPDLDIQLPEIQIPDVSLELEAAALALQNIQIGNGVGSGIGVGVSSGKGYGDSVERAYDQARNYIDRDQYDRALEPLDRVISSRGERADGALYWKAYSLSKLARRDEALTTLNELEKAYGKSRWIKDAQALELQLKQASGQSVAADSVDDELKILALQGLMHNEAETALPIVEKMLAGNGSVRVKDRALFVVSQANSAKAREILGNVARGNSNPDLQMRAIRYLGATANNADAASTLVSVYNSDSSMDIRQAVIRALGTNSSSAAAAALVSLARNERNGELKTSMVRYLVNNRSAEARAFMLEILSK